MANDRRRVRLLRACAPLRDLGGRRQDRGVSSSAPARTTEAIRTELLAAVDPTCADERLLVELAAGAAAIAFQVGVAADRLAHVLPETLAEPKKAAIVAKVLHDIAVVENALVRRIESTLSTAATLRVQRRVHRGAGG